MSENIGTVELTEALELPPTVCSRCGGDIRWQDGAWLHVEEGGRDGVCRWQEPIPNWDPGPAVPLPERARRLLVARQREWDVRERWERQQERAKRTTSMLDALRKQLSIDATAAELAWGEDGYPRYTTYGVTLVLGKYGGLRVLGRCPRCGEMVSSRAYVQTDDLLYGIVNFRPDYDEHLHAARDDAGRGEDIVVGGTAILERELARIADALERAYPAREVDR